MNLSQAVKNRLAMKRQRGVTMIEYAMIAALVAIAALGALGALGGGITEAFNSVVDAITPAATLPPPTAPGGG